MATQPREDVVLLGEGPSNVDTTPSTPARNQPPTTPQAPKRSHHKRDIYGAATTVVDPGRQPYGPRFAAGLGDREFAYVAPLVRCPVATPTSTLLVAELWTGEAVLNTVVLDREDEEKDDEPRHRIVLTQRQGVHSHVYPYTDAELFYDRWQFTVDHKAYQSSVPQRGACLRISDALPKAVDDVWGCELYKPSLLSDAFKTLTGVERANSRKAALLDVLRKVKGVMTDLSITQRRDGNVDKHVDRFGDCDTGIEKFWLHTLQHGGYMKPGGGGQVTWVEGGPVCMTYDLNKLRGVKYMNATSEGYLRLTLGRLSERKVVEQKHLLQHPMTTRGGTKARGTRAQRVHTKVVRTEEVERCVNRVIQIDAHRLLAWMVLGRPTWQPSWKDEREGNKKHQGQGVEGQEMDEKGFDVHHSCGNTRCLNPAHLQWLSWANHFDYHVGQKRERREKWNPEPRRSRPKTQYWREQKARDHDVLRIHFG